MNLNKFFLNQNLNEEKEEDLLKSFKNKVRPETAMPSNIRKNTINNNNLSNISGRCSHNFFDEGKINFQNFFKYFLK